jgi:hypothetical protein
VTGLWVARLQPPLLAAPDLIGLPAGWNRLGGLAPLADAGADPPLRQRLFVRARGVAAVGPELAGTDLGLGEQVEQRQQVALLVLVARPQADGERQPAGVDG